MIDITDNPDLASDLSVIAMLIIKSNDPDLHGELQEAFAAALAPFEAENQRLTRLALKAFTVVEWVAGEGFLLPDPHYDADDLLLEMARALGVEDSVAARAALRSTEASHD